MRKILITALWGLSMLLLLTTPDLVFSEENSGPIDQDRLDHFTEKYPEVPESILIPTLKIRGFGDFSFFASKQDGRTRGEYESRFSTGTISLLFLSQINDRVDLLSELSVYRDIYIIDPTSPAFLNAGYFEFQRFVLKYSLSDDVNIGVGRFHTALGYWNHTYHHGTWLQPSILRPEIYRFEYNGGILPSHSVGVELYGFKVINSFDLRYHLGVSNGRGKKIWSVQNFRDANRSKALTVFLTAQPHFVEELRLGASYYLDTIPRNPNPTGFANTPAQPNPTDEQIVGTHIIYIHPDFEFLAEFFQFHHSEENTGLDFDSEGGYLQGNYKRASIITYYRYDFIDFAEGNPVFWSFHKDNTKHTLGLRWDIYSWNALKFELGRKKNKNEDPEYSVLINTSFTF